MGVYVLTVFEKDGSKALDESFEAATEKEAKAKGESILQEKDCMKKHIAVHLLQVSSFYSSAKKKRHPLLFHSTISSSHHVNTTSRMRLPIRTRLFHFPVWI